MVFIPTYLYIKQHSITGKLYFGKSTRKESRMLTYRGSGKRWKSHINKHGKEFVITLWYELYDNVFDLVADALSMSKSFDIVNNESWLNLIPENGLYGSLSGEAHHMYGRRGINSPIYGIPQSEEHRRKIGDSRRGDKNPSYGKSPSEETRLKLKITSTGKTHSKETIEHLRIINSGENNPMYGKTGILSPIYGKPKSEEHRKNLSKAKMGKTMPRGKDNSTFGKGVLYNIRCKNTNIIFINMTIPEFFRLFNFPIGSYGGFAGSKRYKSYEIL